MAIDKTYIKDRFVSEAKNSLGGSSATSALLWLIIAVLIVSVVAAPIGVIFAILRLKRAKQAKATKQMVELIEAKGLVCLARLIMVNTALRNSDQFVPVLALVTTDPELDEQSELNQLAQSIALGEEGGNSLSSEGRQFAQDLLNGQDYQPFRRRHLPETMTSHQSVYAVDVQLTRLFLPPGIPVDSLPGIPCIMSPGDGGVILQIPYWLTKTGMHTPNLTDQLSFTAGLNLQGKLWAQTK